MLGYIANRKKVAEYLASADVAIAPGPLETFCLSALESLASGTPVIVASAGASCEVVDSTCGAVVDLQPAKIVAAINQFRQLSREDLRIQCELRAGNFTWAATGARMVELLKQGQYSPFSVERQAASIWALQNAMRNWGPRSPWSGATLKRPLMRRLKSARMRSVFRQMSAITAPFAARWKRSSL